MQITDPIADLLTRIRNASTAKHPSVEIPASNLKKAICQILVDEGYIKGMKVTEDTKQEPQGGKSYSEADVEAKIAEAKAAWEAEQQEKQRLAKLPPEERAKAEGEAQAQELTKLRTELLQRDLKDAAVKKLTDEGFPVGLADLLTYTDKESMEKSLQQTQEVFKSALEAAVKERLRGKTPEGLGGGAKAENTVKDQIAQGIRGGMM